MSLRNWILLGAVLVVPVQAQPALARDEVAAVKATVKAYYSSYAQRDTLAYRAALTEDYALLEHGTMLDAAGDIALLGPPDSTYRRSDAFDFRSVKVQGDVAYAVYFLKSEIKDREGLRQKEWLESMILRRTGSAWRVALLHSTRIKPPGK